MRSRAMDGPPAGYSEGPDDMPLPEFDVRCIVSEVGAVETPFGLRPMILATGAGSEVVGVLLDLDDIDALTEIGRRIRAGVLLDA